jgi:lysophospholipase L1-like esterase
VLFIVGVLVAMALAEGILRLFPNLLAVEVRQTIAADPDNYGIANPYIGMLGTPNRTFVLSGRDFRAVNHTDSYGFRNAWPWPEKADVVAVGDSVVFGYGVADDQSWPALVAKELPHESLINLGMVGTGAQQYLRIYETFGSRLHPKVLLVGFLLSNDFWDDAMFDSWLKSGAQVNYMVWRDFGHPKSTTLSLHQPIGNLITSMLWRGHLLASRSRLYSLVFYVLRQLKKEFSGRSDFKPIIFRAPDGTQLQLDVNNFVGNTSMAQELSIKALERLYSITQTNGAQMLVILQPSKEEVYLPIMGEINVDSDPGKALRAKLASLGIPYLDLLPEFRKRAAKGEVLFFEVDGHPNARGYALIAELVLDHLKNNAQDYKLKMQR